LSTFYTLIELWGGPNDGRQFMLPLPLTTQLEVNGLYVGVIPETFAALAMTEADLFDDAFLEVLNEFTETTPPIIYRYVAPN
jgi:hypothetical protein